MPLQTTRRLNFDDDPVTVLGGDQVWGEAFGSKWHRRLATSNLSLHLVAFRGKFSRDFPDLAQLSI